GQQAEEPDEFARHELPIGRKPGLAAPVFGAEVAEEADERTAYPVQRHQSAQEQERGSQILAARNLPLLARLLAAMRCRLLCFLVSLLHKSNGESGMGNGE